MVLPAFLARAEDAASSENLEKVLALLAERASLHRSLLYKFQCTEDVTKLVYRRPESTTGSRFVPGQRRHLRHGLVLEKGEDGLPREARVRLDSKGRVRLNRKGLPIEDPLPPEFRPISRAVPYSQASWFTTEYQKKLTFRLVSGTEDGEPAYRIPCPDAEGLPIEFLDPAPRQGPDGCTGLASGQLCAERDSGEIRRIAFYRFLPGESSCRWDREGPFSFVEQALQEQKTGLRFPSRIKTVYSIDWRDNAIFDQLFQDCTFAEVIVREQLGGTAADRP